MKTKEHKKLHHRLAGVQADERKMKSMLSIAQYLCQLWETRLKGKITVNYLPEEGDKRSIDKRDEDRAGAKPIESSCQDKRKHGRENQHYDIIGKLYPIDIKHEAVGNFPDQKLIDGNRP